MPAARSAVLYLLTCCVPLTVTAQLQSYDARHLVVRSAVSGAYRVPDGAVLEGETPRLDEWLQVAVRVSGLAGATPTGAFFGGAATGTVAFAAAAGVELNHPHVSAGGTMVFEMLHSGQDGIYALDLASVGAPTLVTSLPTGATSWDSPQLNSSGQIGYRAVVDGSYRWVSWDGGAVAEHAAEVGSGAPGSPYSLLYRPSFNDARQMAGKVRLGAEGEVEESRPDQIRLIESDGSFTLIAEDADSNAASPWAAFDAWVSLTDGGWVAFVATGLDGYRYVLFSDGATTVPIADDSIQQVGSIENTPVAACNRGLVAFRGTNEWGDQAIAVGDGTTLEPVAFQFSDTVLTDLGYARYRQVGGGDAFSGEISMDRFCSVAFVSDLTPADNDTIDWGTGLVIATAGVLHVDGFEAGDLRRW